MQDGTASSHQGLIRSRRCQPDTLIRVPNTLLSSDSCSLSEARPERPRILDFEDILEWAEGRQPRVLLTTSEILACLSRRDPRRNPTLRCRWVWGSAYLSVGLAGELWVLGNYFLREGEALCSSGQWCGLLVRTTHNKQWIFTRGALR